MAADAATGRDRSLENARPLPRRGIHNDRELVHERIERHRVAGQKISMEQIARISRFVAAPKEAGEIRDGDQHRLTQNAQKLTKRLAPACRCR